MYSPAITDGSLGDMLYFHSYKKDGLKVDILEDLRNLNNLPVRSCNTGVIILGGGLIKHHILNANLMVILEICIFLLQIRWLISLFSL